MKANPQSEKIDPRTPSKINVWLSNWSKFSLSSYKKDLSWVSFYWSLILISVFILFQEPIKKLLNSIIVEPIIAYCPRRIWTDIVFLSLGLLSLRFFGRQIKKHIVPTANSLLLAAAIVFVYFSFFKTDHTYTFYHYSTSFFFFRFTYATSFIFSALALMMSYKSYLLPLTKPATKFSLIEDYPSLDKYTDFYGRSGYAASVAKHIYATSSNVAFAVGIIGDWGSGKSDFMLRLQTAIKAERDSENIIFEFNRRCCTNT